MLRIVDDHGKLVREGPVRALHKEVAAFMQQVLPIGALNCIGKRIGRIRHAKPEGGMSNTFLLGPFCRAEPSAGSWIDEFFSSMGRRCGMQIGSRTEARIEQSFVLKRFECCVIRFIAVVLKIGTPIPFKSQQLEITLNGVDIFGLRALAVEVLDAQHHSPTL